MAASPLPSRAPKRGRRCYATSALSRVRKQSGTESKLDASPVPSRGPKQGGNAMSPLHSWGIPKQRRTKSEVAAFPGAQKRAELLPRPYIVGDPQKKWDKIRSGCLIPAFSGAPNMAKMLCQPRLPGGPKEGGNATSPLHSRGSPNKGGQNQNWLPHACLLAGRKEGGNATPPLHTRGGRKIKQQKFKIG